MNLRWDYGNRNKEQLVPAVCEQGTETRNTYEPDLPARPPEANLFLICRSASESVFPGILDQIFRGFIDSKNVFSDTEVLKI
jgi:hypothetical protein